MKEKNRFSKPVAFNSKNAIDIKILEYVKHKNFSGYVKKLILKDIAEQGNEPKTIVEMAVEQSQLSKWELLKKELSEKRVNNNPGSNADS